MGVLYLYRIATFVVAMILAIIVVSLGAQTDNKKNALPDQLRGVGFNSVNDNNSKLGNEYAYAHTAIAASAFTLISLPIMLALDFFGKGPLRFSVVVELVWLAFLWLIWIVAAALTFSEANWSSLGIPSCNIFGSVGVPALSTICKDAQPIGVISAIAAGILFLYALVLLVVAATQAGRGQSIWGTAVRDTGKV